MPRVGVRFRPPRVDWTPELRWAFLRAFGPSGQAAPGLVTAPDAVSTARAFDLGPRIAARTPFGVLQAELGAESARDLVIEGLMAEAVAERLLGFARTVAEVAAEVGTPLAFLKGTALRLQSIGPPGGRWVGDVDALFPEARVAAVDAALAGRGLLVEGFPPTEHHLPPRHTERGETVEMHFGLPGLRLGAGRSFATFEDLRAAGLLARVDGMPGESFVPVREVLVAHALVHGIAQHGLAPGSYPMTRMLADLVDLGLATGDGSTLLDTVMSWIAGDVTRDEAEAARGLCAALTAGDATLFADATGERGEVVLLRHVVAGASDATYERSLRTAALLSFPTGRSRAAASLRMVYETVVLSRAQIDVIYGPQKSWRGYLFRRLARPFDLGWRLVRSLAAGIAVRSRRAT